MHLNLDDIRTLLTSSFDDHYLDKDEKADLITALSSATREQKSFARNTAFSLIKENITGDQKVIYSQLKWLERVIKAIDSSIPATHDALAFFSPGEECRKAILRCCLDAKKSIDVCVFTISDNYIRDALLAAHKRDITLRIITDNDKSQDKGSDIHTLIDAGVNLRMDHSRHHMHHKYAIFDDALLLNGSFNWTRSASDWNEENITITPDESLVHQFQRNFNQLWKKFSH